MTEALARCRAAADTHLPLPAGEGVEVALVGNRPWAAFSRYLGGYRSRIELNTDYPLTLDRALQLACHEGYPGHHARTVALDETFARGRGWPEFTVRLQFSPDTFVSEALASVGVDVAFPGDRRAQVLREALLAPAGLSARSDEIGRYVRVQRLVDELALQEAAVVRAYLDGRLEFVRAGDALADLALMANADATLKYANEFRTSVLTYTLGATRARTTLEAGGPDDEARWARYRALSLDPPARALRTLLGARESSVVSR